MKSVPGMLAFLLTLTTTYGAFLNSEIPDATHGLGNQQYHRDAGSWNLTYGQHTDNFLHLFRQASGNVPVSNEREEEDERENTDDDDRYKIHFIPYDIYDLAVVSADVSIVQFSRSVVNRSRISLVVLHHSWKSFLC